MLRTPERRYDSAEILDHVKPMVMRMLETFEDEGGFVSLKKILLRPFFVKSIETADTIQQLGRLLTPSLPRDCCDFGIFDALSGHMTLEEKARHLAPLVEMFKCLLPRHLSLSSNYSCSRHIQERDCVTNFLTLYIEEVRGGQGTSGELVRVVEYVMRTMPVELDALLPYIDPNAVDYLLTCFSDERFHPGGILECDLLAHSLYRTEKFVTVLIRHGFKYTFDDRLYGVCGSLFHHNGFFHDESIAYDFFESGNLRMQMATNILIYLFNLKENREVLCMLWQSVPYPFITPDELYHLMEPFFDPGILVNACERYHEMIPGVPREKQPRSLKHLGRVRIRESMVRAHSLGEKAIRSLGLPKTLEDYLWKLEAF